MHGIAAAEVYMDGIVARNWKKKVLLGVGLLLCIVAMIVFGTYVTYRTGADQLSTGLSTPEEADLRIDVKVENGLVKPQNITSAMGLDNVAPSGNQHGKTNVTDPDVKVRVDGTPIDVPEDGLVHKRINTENGSTSIDVSTQSNSSSGNSRTQSSINIDVDSSVRIRSETRE